MKQGWEIKKLGEVCEIVNGGTPKTNIKEYWDGDINWITPADLGKLTIPTVDKTSRTISRLGLQKSSAKLFSANSVILSTRAPIGHLAINSVPMCTNQGCRGLVPSKKLDVWYVYYFLKANIDLLNILGTGATFKELSNKALSNVTIPLPTFSEQQRIVAIIDQAFAAIDKAKANAEKNLKNARELFESYLRGVFEGGKNLWETKCLEELGTITSSKRIYKSEYVKEGIPFYRTKEIKEISNGKPVTLELFISKDRYSQIKKSFGVPQKQDILMSAVGTIGEIMVVEDDNEFYFKDGNIVWFKDFNEIDSNYLKYSLIVFVEKIKNLAIGAAYNALTIEKLNKYKIIFPCKQEQKEIVEKLDQMRIQIKRLEYVYQKKIKYLEEFKKSILQKAFSGELKTGKVPELVKEMGV